MLSFGGSSVWVPCPAVSTPLLGCVCCWCYCQWWNWKYAFPGGLFGALSFQILAHWWSRLWTQLEHLHLVLSNLFWWEEGTSGSWVRKSALDVVGGGNVCSYLIVVSSLLSCLALHITVLHYLLRAHWALVGEIPEIMEYFWNCLLYKTANMDFFFSFECCFSANWKLHLNECLVHEPLRKSIPNLTGPPLFFIWLSLEIGLELQKQTPLEPSLNSADSAVLHIGTGDAQLPGESIQPGSGFPEFHPHPFHYRHFRPLFSLLEPF